MQCILVHRVCRGRQLASPLMARSTRPLLPWGSRLLEIPYSSCVSAEPRRYTFPWKIRKVLVSGVGHPSRSNFVSIPGWSTTARGACPSRNPLFLLPTFRACPSICPKLAVAIAATSRYLELRNCFTPMAFLPRAGLPVFLLATLLVYAGPMLKVCWQQHAVTGLTCHPVPAMTMPLYPPSMKASSTSGCMLG